MRKTFVLTVTCETAQQLEQALLFAADCVLEDRPRFDEMEVDDSDEQYSDPDDVESMLSRTK